MRTTRQIHFDRQKERRQMTITDNTAEHDEDVAARIALTLVSEPGDRFVWDLVREHGARAAFARLERGDIDDDAARAAVLARLGQFAGSRRLDLHRLAEASIRRTRELGARLVVPSDQGWPRQLDDLATLTLDMPGRVNEDLRPPLCLWVRGSLPLAETLQRSVAISGARAATPYGHQVAGGIAYGMAEDGWTVVSGGGFGIDTTALRAALAAGGRAVTVLACGVDRPYPVGNSALFEQLADTGLLISEWPLGAEPLRHRFAIRQRNIAALTRGAVVVESAMRGGSIQLMDRVLALGRTAMVVPGPVTSALSAGCHELLRSRAATILVTGLPHVREALTPSGHDSIAPADSGPGNRDAATADDEAPTVQDLSRQAGEMGVTGDALDGLVHDVASQLGSDANNGGLDAQVAFLLHHLGPDKTLHGIRDAAPATVDEPTDPDGL
jgi:DNA processing protein